MSNKTMDALVYPFSDFDERWALLNCGSGFSGRGGRSGGGGASGSW